MVISAAIFRGRQGRVFRVYKSVDFFYEGERCVQTSFIGYTTSRASKTHSLLFSLLFSLSLSRDISLTMQNHRKLEDGPFVAGFFSFGLHLRRGGGSSGVGRVLLRLGLGLLLLRREFFLAGTFVGVPVRLARDGRFERFRIISGRGGEVAARSV